MGHSNPLLLVLFTIVILWIIGILLSRAQSKLQLSNPKSKIRGVKLGNQLHVVGLNDTHLDQLKSILLSQDVKMLSFFIAYYKPTFVELEECITTLRTRFGSFLAKPINEASEIEKIAAANRVLLADQPRRYHFSSLNRAELRHLYEFDSENTVRRINYEFITKFGGNQNFMETYRLYVKLRRSSRTTQYINKDSDLRTDVELLVKSGLVLQGRKIQLKDRLTVLNSRQLKEIADELKINAEYLSKDQLTDALAKVPGSAILLAMIYSIDDLFLVKSDSIDDKVIENEWSAYLTYAKLVVGADQDNLDLSNPTMLVNDFQ